MYILEFHNNETAINERKFSRSGHNQFSTPLLSSAFSRAVDTDPVLAYISS